MCDLEHHQQKKLSVLLVDDDEFFGVNFAALLRRAGHTVHFAVDAARALSDHSSLPIDVAFIDLYLPYQAPLTSDTLPVYWGGLALATALQSERNTPQCVFLVENPLPQPILDELRSKIVTPFALILKLLPDFDMQVVNLLRCLANHDAITMLLPKVQPSIKLEQLVSPEERDIITQIWLRLPNISEIEWQVIQHLVEGKRPAVIGELMGIAAIDNIITRICNKLGLVGDRFTSQKGLQRSVILAKAIFIRNLAGTHIDIG